VTLDAVEVGKKAGMPIALVMIYGDDVSHVVTEEGVDYLWYGFGTMVGMIETAPDAPISRLNDAKETT
jgi:hypothetical protein